MGQRRSGSQVQFVIEGNDYNVIQDNMNVILDELKKNPNFTFYDVDYKKTRPQLKVYIDRSKTAELEISSNDIGEHLKYF